MNVLPVGITGLLIASIFAAGMSTISTSLNNSATVILTDFYKRVKTQTSEKESIRVLNIASGVMIILGITISFFMISVESAHDLWWNLADIFSGKILGLFLLAYFSKKVNNASAAISIARGLLVIIWMSLAPICFKSELAKFKSPFHDYLTIVIGTIVIFFTGFLVSVLAKHIKNGL